MAYLLLHNSVNISSNSYKNILSTPNNTKEDNKTQIIESITVGDDTKSVGSSTILAYKKNTQYIPNNIVGIDSTLGDIVIGKNELIILRGGWSNRNDVYFSEDPTSTSGLSTLNIIWKGVTTKK